jgi:hypothetical protein
MDHRHAPRYAALFALAVGLTGQAPAPAQPYSTGRSFTIPVRARTSARAAFREALPKLRELSGVRLMSAFADREDRFVEAFYTAAYHGRPVAGALVAVRAGAAGAFDTPRDAPRTIPVMLDQLSRAFNRGVPVNDPLHTVSFGSGTIGLPDSWSVTNAYQGCVEAASPRDHGYLAFGCPQAAVVPPLLPGTNPRAALVLTSGDPVAVAQRVLTAPPPAGLGVKAVRVVETQPVAAPMGTGSAAYVLFDYRADGAPFRGLGLFAVAPVDARSAMVYKSIFMLPANDFARLAPVLWKSWRSWNVNGNVLTGRLTAAAQSMRETGDIITGAYWAREHAQDQAAYGFDQYIRDTAQLEDVTTGRRYNGSYLDASAIVQRNPVKYRIVPIGELQL